MNIYTVFSYFHWRSKNKNAARVSKISLIKNLGFEIQATVAAIQTAMVDQNVWISEP